MQNNVIEVTRIITPNGCADVIVKVKEDWIENPFPSLLFNAVSAAANSYTQMSDANAASDFIAFCMSDVQKLHEKEAGLELRMSVKQLERLENLRKHRAEDQLPAEIAGHLQITYVALSKTKKARLIGTVPTQLVAQFYELYKAAIDNETILEVTAEPRQRKPKPNTKNESVQEEPPLQTRELSRQESVEVQLLLNQIKQANERIDAILFGKSEIKAA